MEDWYEQEHFRGHVREPDVQDLGYIAEDMGLTQVQITGRNWSGYRSRRPWVRALTPAVDVFLRVFPSMCSNIYMVGRSRLE
jgi:hypothetical protein